MLAFEVDKSKFAKYGLKQRQINNAVKSALFAMAGAWHSRYLMQHFDETATEKYRYTKRKGQGMDPSSKAFRRSYWGIKHRQSKGRPRPLVKSGQGMLLAVAPKILGTSKEARAVLPSKFNFRHPKSRVNMREEITRVLPEEAAELVIVARRELRHAIQRPPAAT
jgi:hypothetical protein